jgi:hypothetical protein
MTQGQLFGRTARSTLCPYETPCPGVEMTIGPCEPVSAACCSHALRCVRCERTGHRSWNLVIGKAEHDAQ